MIQGFAWALFFVAWFWVDARWSDPAILKEIMLPLTLGGLLLSIPTKWRPGVGGWLFLGFVAWSLAWMRGCAPAEQTVIALVTGCMAFLLGTVGGRPPIGMAMVALALAVGKGWDDLLFLSNIGGGIPFTTTSFFVHRNLFALILAPTLFLLAGWLTACVRGRAWKWAGWSLVVVGSVLLIVSESRGAALGFVAGVGMLLIGWAWRASTLRIRILCLGCLVFAMGGGFALQVGRLDQTRQEVVATLRGAPITTGVQARFRPWVWKGALSLWQEAPIVGVGVGEFRYGIESVMDPWEDIYRDRRVRVDVAHSHWLQTLVERGVVGLALEVLLWILASMMAYRSGARFLAAALVCMGVHGLVGEGLEYTQGAILWWYLIGTAMRGDSSVGISVRWVGAGLSMLLLYPLVTFTRIVFVEQEIEQARRARTAMGSDALANAWEKAPRSPEVLLEIASSQVQAGMVLDARQTLEYRRSLCPRPCALGGDVLLAGVWRATGAMDSAQALLATCLRLYPTDPWFVHDFMRQRRAVQGCSAVRGVIDSVGRRMDAIFLSHGPPRPASWPTWRHRLVLDRELAESAKIRVSEAGTQALRLASREWIQARSMCADSL